VYALRVGGMAERVKSARESETAAEDLSQVRCVFRI
jgi:hypothetical protein